MRTITPSVTSRRVLLLPLVPILSSPATSSLVEVSTTMIGSHQRHHTLATQTSHHHHQYRFSSSCSATSASPSQIDDWLHCMEFPAPQNGCTITAATYEGGISNVKLKGRFIELVKRYHPDTYMNASSSSNGGGRGENKEETVDWLNTKVISIVDAHSNLKKVPQEKRQRQAPMDYSSSSASSRSQTSSGGRNGTAAQQVKSSSYKDYEAD